ncbi:tyrosine-type recombinase/integrase [Nocardia cyriacigeorgica]|uniref:tyrosine-type recombinase/integrase n=1 Tax=Nocardia cyriacigeorgica TaxID=135487 RepID=UPI002490AB81|nr:site-specific integrase [Nocardia cyriacigeorgica]BDU04088.1 site-specific integrase [Nocardia cyriacigeorgica]
MADKNPARKRNPNGSGTIGTRKDGRYELKMFVDAPDGTRKRISVYGATWEEADAERTRLKELQRRAIPVDVTTMTVRQYLQHWLENVAKPSVRPTTYVTWESLVRLYMIPGLGRHKLRSLQAKHIRDWLNKLARQCQCCTQKKDAKRAEKGKARCCAWTPAKCCQQYPSTGTLRTILRVLRAAIQDAVEEDLLARNVAKQVKMPAGRVRKEKPWSEAEALQFLETAKDHRLYALWSVALAIGLRRGEALGLRWTDVDLTEGTVDIARALYRVGGRLDLFDVKTEGSEATVPLPPKLLQILRQHRRDQLQDTELAKANKLGLVFTTTKGTPLEPRNINRAFSELVKKAGVRPIRLHDLRHSCATLLFAQGVEAATVQRILRHSSISTTTSIYMDVIERVQRDAVAGMDGLFRDQA